AARRHRAAHAGGRYGADPAAPRLVRSQSLRPDLHEDRSEFAFRLLVRRSAIDWAVDPEGFRDTLIEVSRDYGLPVYVTENGMGSRETLPESGVIIDNDRIE